MPIPFIVGAALAGLATAAGVGVKKTIDAHQDNKEANRVNERANDIIQSATNEANTARKDSNNAVKSLGDKKFMFLTLI